MRDERSRVDGVSGLPAQPHLERRQRTDHAQPDLRDDDITAFTVARARQVLALSTLNYSTEQMPPVRTSVPGVLIANSAQIPHGTLNVNETIGVVEQALPHVLEALDAHQEARL